MSRALLYMLVLIATLLSLACTVEEESEARLRFAAIGWEGRASRDASLEFTFDDGARSGVIVRDQLAVDDDYAQPHSRWLPTATTGRLRVSVVVLEPDGVVVGEESVELELRPDWAWEVQAHVSADDPARTCFGCAGSRRVTPADSRDEAVWLVWAGNRISDPVIY